MAARKNDREPRSSCASVQRETSSDTSSEPREDDRSINPLSLIEGATVVMGSHYQIEDWIMVTSTVCIFFNIPLIVWLGRLYIREWQRENQIRKQYKG